MNSHQERLLGLLKEIDAICAQRGIAYFVCNGTLIGAMRNGGFIPWDDDIDIMMTYDNWERFKAACQQGLPEERVLAACDTQESHSHLLGRYVDTSTTWFHPYQTLHDDTAGDLIDIFVLDPISGLDEFDAYRKDVFLYAGVYNYSRAYECKVEVDPALFALYQGMSVDRGSIRAAKDLERRLVSHFGEGDYYACRWAGVVLAYKRSWFKEARWIPFEDMMVPAPVGVHGCLSTFFGDEWETAPSKINYSKHGAIHSLDFSYRDALDYYEPKHDRDELLAEMRACKIELLANAPVANRLRDMPVLLQRGVVESEFVNMTARTRAAFEAALAARDGEALSLMLAKYLEWQTSPAVLGRILVKWAYRQCFPVLADVGPDVFAGALLALIHRGDIREAVRLLEIFRAEGRESSPLVDEVERDLAAYHEAKELFHGGRAGECLPCANGLVRKYPRAFVFRQFQCMALGAVQEESGREDDIAVLEEAAREARGLFPGDGMFVKCLADCLWARGERAEAERLYLQAAEHTRHGFALSAIAERTGYYPRWQRDTEWGREAGIPQWNGPEPEPLEAPAAPREGSGDPIALEPCQEYLVALLSELARFCDERGIAYLLGPTAAKAFARHHRAPENMEAYELVMRGDDFERLLEALVDDPPADRYLACEAGEGGPVDAAVRYYGIDSVAVPANGSMPGDDPHLFVTIVPAQLAGKPVGLHVGKRAKLPAGFFAGGADISFCGYRFRVPAEFGAYLALSRGCRPGDALDPGKKTVYGAFTRYEDLVASGAADPWAFARLSSRNEPVQRKYRAVKKKFNYNTRQIELAVQLKRVSLELLPEKNRIAKLLKRGDRAALKSLLGDYLRLAKDYEGVGTLNFDDDVYRALEAVREPWWRWHGRRALDCLLPRKAAHKATRKAARKTTRGGK